MKMEEVTFFPQGDHAVAVVFNNKINRQTHSQIRNFSSYLMGNSFDGMVEVVPGYTSVTVYYDPIKVKSVSPYEEVVTILKKQLSRQNELNEYPSNIVTIPVCYGEKYGPDLSYVAAYHNLSEQEVIDIHTHTEYLVYMIGFAPGFPYLGGMSQTIATPRKDTPKVNIPAGSIGIGGEQTGIYPIDSPGGWQLIGQTPITLFDQHQAQPSLLKAGDIVRFVQITPEKFEDWEVGDHTWR
ncbi:5-oxoprolinase subunit PxpB [Metabacillus halosaccharovorans]